MSGHDDGYFVKAFINGLVRRAATPGVPPGARVEFAAVARTNPAGHAHLAPGQLRSMLGLPDTDAGRSTVTKALTSAKRDGLISPDSTARLVVIDRAVWLRGRNPFDRCPVEGCEVPTFDGG